MKENLKEFRGKIYDSITDTIGATPLVRINKLTVQENSKADVLAKLEFFNPLASVKDRIGLAMIAAAEKEKKLNSDSVIVEPTSGNTGIALAFVAAARGYRSILVMPDSMSQERRKMLLLMGAELILTPAADGIRGAISKAEKIISETPNSFMPQQFKNTANPEIHRNTTAHEIWNDTNGDVNAVVTGVGTGGTLTGIAETLKTLKPDVKIFAVEPEDSSVLSGGAPGIHKIQGIGAGFIPDILNTDLIDEVLPIANETALRMARLAARFEGIPCGISSGAALAAALEVSKRDEMTGQSIVVILPSFAERYLSTSLFEGI